MDSAEIAEAVAETSQTAFLPLFEFQQINSCDRSGVTPEYWKWQMGHHKKGVCLVK